MAWWIAGNGSASPPYHAYQARTDNEGWNPIAYSFPTRAAAEAWINAHSGGGGGGGGCGTPVRGWTFAQWRDWANCKSPGAGDKFWTWMLGHVTGPFPAPKLSDTSYGDASFAEVLRGYNTTSAGWFGAWLASQITADLATLLANGISAGAKDTIIAAGGAAGGLQGMYQGGVLGFLGNLENGNLWIRAGQVLLGIILIAIGVARMTNAVPIATKIAKKAGMAAMA